MCEVPLYASNLFLCNIFFNEADTLESSSILIYSELHKGLGWMPHKGMIKWILK
jgi:hypothetical protein